MSDVGDDDLLNGEDEFDYEDYDLDYEKEEALLQEEEYDTADLQHNEDYIKPSNVRESSDKKEPVSDLEEPEDILNLDIEGEEEFQEVEDKPTYEEEQQKKKQEKFSVERTPQVSTTTATKIPLERGQVVKRPAPTTGTTPSQDKRKVQNQKPPLRNDKRKRGIGRSNFQTRTNFNKNLQKERRQERRNGTVLINPRYQGIVHINENNARLAWDSPQYPPNNSHFIQPWASGNVPGNQELHSQGQSLLLNNLVSEIATTFSQTPTNLFQLPPPSQPPNLFHPPPNMYQSQLTFQPPPSAQNSSRPYNNENQASPRPMFSSQTNVASHQSYTSSGVQQQFNKQQFNERTQGASKPYDSYTNYNCYNRSNNQQSFSTESKKPFSQPNCFENRNLNYNRANVKQNDYDLKNKNYRNTYPKQDDYQNRNSSFVNVNYQNRNSNYNNDFSKQDDYNKNLNYNSVKFENRVLSNRNDFKQESFENRNPNFSVEFKQNVGTNQIANAYRSDNKTSIFNNKPQNKPLAQNEFNKPNLNSAQRDNNTLPNRNFSPQKNRWPTVKEREPQCESLEKKIKTEDSVNKYCQKDEPTQNEQSKKQTPVNPNNAFEDEDEETRLYRLKIEEQKREREKVLKMKEERRKMMLQEQKMKEEALLLQTTKPPVAVAMPQKVNYPQQVGRAAAPQQPTYQVMTAPQQSTYQVSTASQQPIYHNKAAPQQPIYHTKTAPQQPIYHNKMAPQQPRSEDDLSNITFKVSNNLQRSAPITVKNVQKSEPSSSNFMSNRVVVVKNNNQKGGVLSNPNVVKTVSNETNNETADVVGVSSFFNNRKVLKKDSTLINTRLVVVNNLSASTSENKLVTMTRGIGEIQKLRMDKQERQATILFKSVASAHAFFKKYQRYMLDLSMIEVKLESML